MLLFFTYYFLRALQYWQHLIGCPVAFLSSAWESRWGPNLKQKISWDGKPASSSLQINYIFWNDFLAVFATEASPLLCSASIPWAILLRRLPDPCPQAKCLPTWQPRNSQAEGRSLQLLERTADCLPAGDCEAELAQKGQNPRVLGGGELRNQRNVCKPALGTRQMAGENLFFGFFSYCWVVANFKNAPCLFSKAGELIP